MRDQRNLLNAFWTEFLPRIDRTFFGVMGLGLFPSDGITKSALGDLLGDIGLVHRIRPTGPTFAPSDQDRDLGGPGELNGVAQSVQSASL